MTNDELLARIDDSTDGLKHEDIFLLLINNTNALRKIAELCYEALSDIETGGLAETILEIIKKELG
jgi:hypothetical protein